MTDRLNIFLDLDQTIISATTYSKAQEIIDAAAFDYDTLSTFIIAARPNLQIFLDYLFQNHNVSIWTAASKLYATFIYDRFIKSFDRNRQLKMLLYDEHGAVSRSQTGHGKSLSLLWDFWKIPGYSPSNTIIIDDLDEVYRTQPANCIKIKPFYFFDKDAQYDNELMNVVNIIMSRF
ncbi:hypothetical protein AV955_gp117 [Diadromus pulchellus ascovirus 4a]|uniref:Complete DpAV4 genome n=1 Tax=Diadromus pulchellus ascovirus 4a TaxID=158683 RepID=F2NZ46_9VIRU|nr:hypothetical protein AV955_gp117 [Diadromus pulchellus ascovirus 4a]CCA61474.1 unnamed protein product [Diadromus pulchellus ascovirus 4a]